MDINTTTVGELLNNPAACNVLNSIEPKILKSPLVKMFKGKTIAEALTLTNKAVMDALDGLPPVKVHCSVLAEQAVKSALSDYYRRRGIDPLPIVGEISECDACHMHDGQ